MIFILYESRHDIEFAFNILICKVQDYIILLLQCLYKQKCESAKKIISAKKLSFIQHGYRKCLTHAPVFSRTLTHAPVFSRTLTHGSINIEII